MRIYLHFIDHNARHLIDLNQQADVQYVSRLQCVQTAVNEQIETMAKMVILCADGLANIGVGSLDAVQIEADEDKEDLVLKWYEAFQGLRDVKGRRGEYISITDDGCKLENLSKIVEVNKW
eukprot:1146523_1